jgi:hypothetical protein
MKTTLNSKLSEVDPALLGNYLPTLSKDLTYLRSNLRPFYPLFDLLHPIPILGRYASQVRPLLEYAGGLANAGNLIFQSLSPLLENIDSSTDTTNFTRQAYQILLDNQSTLAEAYAEVGSANQVRQDIDPSILPAEWESAFTKVDKYFEFIYQGTGLLVVLPDLMGSPNDPQTYLLLAQNHDELRATGGFISGIGIVQIAAGELTSLEISDSYAVDDYSKGYPPPPEPLQRFMLAGYWVPRDANWSPDFPTAARQVQSLYSLSTGQETDGVIAFDQSAISSILSVLGPLHLPDFSEPITADNIEAVIHQAWAPDPQEGLTREWWEHRKDFMPQLGNALVGRLLSIRDQGTLIRLAQQILTTVKSGHLLLYFDHPQVQAILSNSGLDNAVRIDENDYLLLVDSNIGFNKTDAVIQRSVAYHLDLTTPSNPQATLTLNYTHTVAEDIPCIHKASYGSGTYQDLQTRCYWNYWRVYLPPDTQLVDYSRLPVPGEWLLNKEDWNGKVSAQLGEHNALVLSGLLVLPTASSQDIWLKLSLPPRLVQQDASGNIIYRLRVQKQAGLDNLPFTLQVTPPSGYVLTTQNSGWAPDTQTATWTWTGKLYSTKEFELIFSAQEDSPID